MINLTQPAYTPFQNKGGSETEYDMNSLAKRYNAETKLLTNGTGKCVIIRKRKVSSYIPIMT